MILAMWRTVRLQLKSWFKDRIDKHKLKKAERDKRRQQEAARQAQRDADHWAHWQEDFTHPEWADLVKRLPILAKTCAQRVRIASRLLKRSFDKDNPLELRYIESLGFGWLEVDGGLLIDEQDKGIKSTLVIDGMHYRHLLLLEGSLHGTMYWANVVIAQERAAKEARAAARKASAKKPAPKSRNKAATA